MITAIVLSAGNGSRMKSPVKKQYMMLQGKPLVYYSLKAFNDCEKIDNIIVVTSEEDVEYKEVLAANEDLTGFLTEMSTQIKTMIPKIINFSH